MTKTDELKRNLSISGRGISCSSKTNHNPGYKHPSMKNSNNSKQSEFHTDNNSHHFLAVIIVLLTWLAGIRSRPNYRYSTKPSIAVDSYSVIQQSSWDDSGVTDKRHLAIVEPWEPLSRPKNTDSGDSRPKTPWKSSHTMSNLRAYQPHMLRLLNTDSARCNDGSPAGYYYREAKHKSSNNWLIFLEGGWYCFDKETCDLRESNAHSLFSSKTWSRSRSLGGILSSDPSANPLYHEYHSVFIPYCSSDLWTGKFVNKTEGFYFHGSRILRAVIEDLPWQLFPQTERVVFAGSSAGGIGVLMNVDRLSQKLFNRIGHPVLVSGIIDSAWFIQIPAFQESRCTNAFECPPEEGIHKGMKFWNARIPKLCRRAQPTGQKWRCYLAPYMYRHLRSTFNDESITDGSMQLIKESPVYIVQSLFDEAQMQMSKVPLLTGGTYTKWAYIQNLGKKVAQSLKMARGVFAPSCLDHEILTKNNWVHKFIGTVGLVNSLQSWDEQLNRIWSTQKLILWSVRYPNILRRRQNRKIMMSISSSQNSNKQQNGGNSSLVFLSRLVHLLNRNSRHRRHVLNPDREDDQSSHDIFDSMRYLSKPHTKSTPFGLTMTKPIQTKRYYADNPGSSETSHEKLIFNRPFDVSPYHTIDSCGLFTINGVQGSYMCKNFNSDQMNSSKPNLFSPHSKIVPVLDHLIPQCNPTCGYVSNPHRMKLVDVLALYEVNTDLLANLLGLTTADLKRLDSEQQMQALFCGKDQFKRDYTLDNQVT